MYCSFCEITKAPEAGSFYEKKKSVIASPDGARFIAAVFDGIGGAERGEMASYLAAGKMGECYDSLQKSDPVAAREEFTEELAKYKAATEGKLIELLLDEGLLQCGTTCCAIGMHGDEVRPFWIGDSRCYLWRDKRLTLLTKDHTLAQENIDSGIMSAEEAEGAESSHCLTAFIGDLYGAFSVGEAFRLRAGDKLILCTDGLNELMAEKRTERMLALPMPFWITYFRMQLRKDRGDNQTGIVLSFI